MVCCARRITRRTRSCVQRSGTRRRATWVVTWITLSSRPMSSMAKSFVSDSFARISVWPECWTPAAASASLLTGAVTMPSMSPAWQSLTARSIYAYAARPASVLTCALRQRGHIDVGKVEALDGAGLEAAFGRTRHRVKALLRAQDLERGLHHRAVADDHGSAGGGNLRHREGLGRDPGPTPAGSPMVMPRRGRRIVVMPSPRERHEEIGGRSRHAFVSTAGMTPPGRRVGRERGRSLERRRAEVPGAERPQHGQRGLAAREDHQRGGRLGDHAFHGHGEMCGNVPARAFGAFIACHEGRPARANGVHDRGDIRFEGAAYQRSCHARGFERGELRARGRVAAASDNEPRPGPRQGGSRGRQQPQARAAAPASPAEPGEEQAPLPMAASARASRSRSRPHRRPPRRHVPRGSERGPRAGRGLP
jgi:hypothetical protein